MCPQRKCYLGPSRPYNTIMAREDCNPTHVTVVASSYYPCNLLAYSLIPADFVEVVVPRFDPDTVTASRMAAARIQFPKLTVTHAPTSFPLGINNSRSFSLPRGQNLVVKFDDPSSILSDTQFLILVEPYSAWSCQIANCARKRGVPTLLLSETSWRSPLVRLPPFSWLAMETLRLADGVVACTTGARRWFEDAGIAGLRIGWQPISIVDPDLFKPPNSKRANKLPTILFVGRLERWKGFETLLHALHLLADDFDFRLEVVGQGTLEPLLRRTSGFEISHVRFLGNSYPEKFASADIFCLPSEPRREFGLTTWEEVVGIPVLEAMSSGLPVVVSDSGELPNLPGPGKLIAPAGQPDALAAAIRSLLSSETLRKRMGDLNRARIEQLYDRREVAKRWLSVLNLANKRG